ncbi:hypothetical protein THAOC_02161 [Thalassiosira oceanica]|uniref:Uncharacterized protein n=1 Tax=Thalassiosira oceanica TaxID=159749 RepID=K0TMD0_THAOC|nr:hypothetical protein THAOC_02161 [Thalassiosira oceanica]|mmetsp:Transcript_16831/g.37129  ORF Transcript_16831/g.37129 Transcript_16831/m.37129 type:complete len:162 (-) Transcript_16831:22-507(-)|eukprot:EJK76096.1 hypothetical protein THAOC_02161 [Thalassiosira oceanica]
MTSGQAPSFLVAAAAEAELPTNADEESQVVIAGEGDGAPADQSKVFNSKVGILAPDDDENDTSSVFSFDSMERAPRIPLRFQHLMKRSKTGENSGSDLPFPSVVGITQEYESTNICPCRCLFFTLKETICLVMSALGCAVFLAGLILLCMYLEGSAFGYNR